MFKKKNENVPYEKVQIFTYTWTETPTLQKGAIF